MGKKDLQAFIAAKDKIDKTKEIDWTKKKDDWLEKLNKLYADIESWLNDFEKDVISIKYIDKEINEEHIGMYSARKMILRIADEQVVLDPVGTLLIGAAGRVDMIGKNGKVKFVLVPASSKGIQIKVTIKAEGEPEKAAEDTQNTAKEDWVWKIATPPPSIKYLEIDSDSFSDALLEVVGG
jgi:lysyl-tRNA synthetase class II